MVVCVYSAVNTINSPIELLDHCLGTERKYSKWNDKVVKRLYDAFADFLHSRQLNWPGNFQLFVLFTCTVVSIV